MQRVVMVLVVLLMGGILAGCSVDESGSEKDAEARDKNNDSLVDKHPAESMDYSPTRVTINHWINTWEEPNKVSYVYFKAANGQITQYAVLKGLPVSYCASLTPPEDTEKWNGGMIAKSAPAMDGAYYSGCPNTQLYGIDAGTNAQLEFSIGGGQDYFLSSQPMNAPEADPVTITTEEDGQRIDEENGITPNE